jgi:hypothetical protein
VFLAVATSPVGWVEERNPAMVRIAVMLGLATQPTVLLFYIEANERREINEKVSASAVFGHM